MEKSKQVIMSVSKPLHNGSQDEEEEKEPQEQAERIAKQLSDKECTVQHLDRAQATQQQIAPLKSGQNDNKQTNRPT